ncbi:unnamed protein product [Soboliphyme baturini]|uniref:5'-deoxynucleotidase HDDC2 n=1 Tax=Soboliphyme baturini TaxID=241478 RepID=A0A183IYQ7_9BILA|nr:unnamed protein product [Soboliphyme baturini]
MKPCDILTFCELLGRLKHLPRTGWVNNGVEHPETVSGHMYRMAMLSLLLGDNDDSGSRTTLDKTKCMMMSLVHDLAESIVGDITPMCGVSHEEKLKREEQALQRIILLLPNEVGRTMFDLWKEFEECSTAEAKAVKDLDKFDMIMQAFEYERTLNRPNFLQPFFTSTQGTFQNPTVLQWVAELEKRRSGCEQEGPN